MTSPEAVSAYDVDDLDVFFHEHNSSDKADKAVSAAIHQVATLLVDEHDGVLPKTRAGLLGLKLDATVSDLLLANVFGIPQLIVGLHARKILVALDMVDWEETGTTQKADVKMINVTACNVKKSLQTWLPPGEKVVFHDLMESLGDIISNKSTGVWGTVTNAINGSFNARDKKALMGMVETISQFYRATTSRGKKFSSPSPE
jgi:endonuclease III